MKKRIKIVKIIVILMAVAFIARALQLQILQGEEYYRLAENNRISIRPVSAPRGRIYSREGDILVSNRLAFDIYFMPNELGRTLSRGELFDRMAATLDYDVELLQENYYRNRELSRPGEGVLIKRNISIDSMIRVQENGNNLPGIIIRESSMRDYVYDDLASHVLGYVGEIGREDLRRFVSEGRDYHGGDIIGITGLEREYEEYLKGEKGEQIIEIDHRGYQESILLEEEPSPGYDLQLNLKRELQAYTEEVLEEAFVNLQEEAEEDEDMESPRAISSMMMEVDSGALITMASYPDFNPNKFALGFSREEYEKLSNDPHQPLLNRNIMVSVPPGSVFKPITGTAGIEHLDISADTEFYDASGEFRIPGWDVPYKNWLNYGEGEIDFTRAMARSNNIIFYEIGYELYEEYRGRRLVETAREFGLGEKTGIDLPQERSGRVPDGEWKRENLGEGWYPGDSVNFAIGQGDLITTPIQMLQMTSAIANRGKIYEPRLLRRAADPEGGIKEDFYPRVAHELPYREDTYETIEQGMIEAVMEQYGTGSEGFEDFPVNVAGKTGTAQMGNDTSHAWFVAYAPVQDPEIALVVFIEEGDTSRNAVPVAADLLEHYLEINQQEGDIQNE